MSTTSYTGTYMTSWQLTDGTYTVGPVIVVGSSTLTVDGVAINDPTFTGAVIVWQAASNNPSSGVLSFYTNNGTNGFTGTYVEGNGSLPSGTNLYGTSATPSQALSTWNATYTTYNVSGGTSTKDGTLVIADPSVTYNSENVQNTIYTGETTQNGPLEQLAWFTTGGNNENVVIQFSSTDSQGYLTFYGTKWTSGTQPSEVNFTGTTASTPPPSNQTVVVLIAVMSSSTEQNATTEVEVSVDVSVDVTVDVTVDVLVADVAAEVGDAPAPGSQKAGDYDADGRAADDLVEKAKLLVSRTKFLD